MCRLSHCALGFCNGSLFCGVVLGIFSVEQPSCWGRDIVVCFVLIVLWLSEFCVYSSITVPLAGLQSVLMLFPGPEVKKYFPCLTKLSKEFILLINVKMQTIVAILTFISIIDI